jgi:hypothetical protein
MPRCHNCNSPYHYSDKCTKSSRDLSKCHNCNQSGHKAADCPNPRKSNSFSTSTCHTCKQTGHKMADCPQKSSSFSTHQPSSSSFSTQPPSSFPPSTCHTCKQIGHKMADCPQKSSLSSSSSSSFPQSTCHTCKKPGHKMSDCPQKFSSSPFSRSVNQVSSQESYSSRQPSSQQSLSFPPPLEKEKSSSWSLNKFLPSSISSFFSYLTSNNNTKTTTPTAIDNKPTSDNRKEMQEEKQPFIYPVLQNSATFTLKFSEMWGNNSALIATSLLYNFKNDFVKALLEEKVIPQNTRSDDPNYVPHVNIKGQKDVFDKLNNTLVVINHNNIKLHENYVELLIGAKYHMTLCYHENLSFHSVKIYEILDRLLSEFKSQAELDVKEFQEQEKKEEERKARIHEEGLISSKCKICFINDFNTTLLPCGHTCICLTCSDRIVKCPICRTQVTSKVRSIIS